MSRKHLVIFSVAAVGLFALTGCTTPPASVNTSASSTSANPYNDVSVVWCIQPENADQKCYSPITVENGRSAYESFMALDEREDDVTFEATDYGAAGYFINSINGVSGSADAFWKLYYNGTEAQTGASSIILNNNDKLEFKYEKVQ